MQAGRGTWSSSAAAAAALQLQRYGTQRGTDPGPGQGRFPLTAERRDGRRAGGDDLQHIARSGSEQAHVGGRLSAAAQQPARLATQQHAGQRASACMPLQSAREAAGAAPPAHLRLGRARQQLHRHLLAVRQRLGVRDGRAKGQPHGERVGEQHQRGQVVVCGGERGQAEIKAGRGVELSSGSQCTRLRGARRPRPPPSYSHQESPVSVTPKCAAYAMTWWRSWKANWASGGRRVIVSKACGARGGGKEPGGRRGG